MKYVNPFAFLEAMNNGPVDPGNTAALSLLRKKMLAEIELADDKMLRVAHHEFSKHDLLQFFDNLSATTELDFHRHIAADRALSYFLETGEITGHFTQNAAYNTAAFRTFIAPYYEPLFTDAVIDSLKNKWLENTKLLFSNPLLLDGEHTTHSFNRIFRYGRVLEEQLKIHIANIRAGEEMNWHVLSSFANAVLVKQLNLLPSEFHEWRSDYGISMINLGMAVYRKDFAHGMSTLQLVEQLTTTRYVQNENAVRKQMLQAHRREQHRNRSLIQHVLWYPGHWLTPIRPRWLSEEGAGGILLGILIVVFYMLNNGPEKKTRAFVTPTDYFALAPTGQPAKYLLYALQMTSGDTTTHKMNRVPKTGEDVFGADFMKAVDKSRFRDTLGLMYTLPESNQRKPETLGETISLPVKHFRQSIHLFNRLEAPAVAMIQTPDTFYSCYIVPGDSAFIPLQLNVNQLYVYVGQHWDAARQSENAMDEVTGYRVRGFFGMPYKDSEKFLRDGSLIFKLDPAYWATSDRNIPIEIGLSANTNLHFNLLDNNAAGVELETGN